MTKAHKHKDAIIAWAIGETIQCWNNELQAWEDLYHPNFNSDVEFRVKPKTISINGIEVPAPEQQRLSEGTRYYVPCLEADDWFNWYDWSEANTLKHYSALPVNNTTLSVPRKPLNHPRSLYRPLTYTWVA